MDYELEKDDLDIETEELRQTTLQVQKNLEAKANRHIPVEEESDAEIELHSLVKYGRCL